MVALNCKNSARGLAASLCLALLAACGGAAQTLPPPKPQPRQATPIMAQEQAAAESGDFAALATLYMEAAGGNLSGNLLTATLLRAGEMQLATGDESAARETLSMLRGNSFQPVLSAQLLMHENLLDAAELKLAELPATVPSSLQPVTAAARATLLAKRGQLPDANTEISAARYTDGPLGGDVERIVSQFQRWQLLNSQRIKPQWLATGNDDQRGWLALANTAQRGWQSPADYPRQIQQWQQRYKNHPGNDRIAPALATNARQATTPQKIALLLPAQSSPQTIAIETGLLAARFNGNADVKVLRVTAESINPKLQSLRNWNADAVISHVDARLEKAVQRFAQQRNAPHVISLNSSQQDENPALAFSLDARSEAGAIADYAVAQQQQRAVLLAPAGPRGDAFGNALELRLAQLGGDTLSQERYSPDQRDFRPILKRLLKIDRSSTREEELGRLLGTVLTASNRGRTDVDFIAIDANPLQAKLIQQQLAELGAGNLPILASSRLTSGRAFELSNIRFAATPWELEASRPASATELASLWPAKFRAHAAHYALGFDAYQLLPLLTAKSTANNNAAADRIWQTGLSQAWLDGGTGKLTVTNNTVDRELPIAEFSFGEIRAAQ